ncbi:MAG: hypothetical protein KC964_26980 [Candidatus Omnitrophica bacterium]|nr:hypothetical protein [Candidatus Omnitrophota bacterium]
MFEHRRGVGVLLLILLFIPIRSTECAVVSLLGGNVYSSLEIIQYDGAKGTVAIEKSGKRVDIQSSEIATVDLDQRLGILTLRGGDVYAGLEIVQFDFPKDRLTVRRGNKTLNLPLSDIASVEMVRETVPMEESQASSVNPKEAETSTAPPKVEGATASQPWEEQGLYSNLPNDFGKKKTTTASEAAKSDGYTARWKTESGKSEPSAKKSEDPKKSRTAVTGRVSSRGEGTVSKRETARDRRQDRQTSSRQSSRERHGENDRDSRSRSRLFDSGRQDNSNETEFGAGR